MLGAAATDLGPWYQALEQPAWKPPDVLFGPAWTLIYALIVMAFVISWPNAKASGKANRLIVVFCVNALLNVLWSALFFSFRRPDIALFEVVLFWLSIVVMIVTVYPLSKKAAALLAPYLAWVTFAGLLNWAVVRINAPF